MKKLARFVAAAVAVCTVSASAISAAAYTEDDVLNLIDTADINGVALDDSYYATTFNYFNTVDIADEDATALYEDIEATIAFCEDKDITSVATLVVDGTNSVDAVDLTSLPMEDKEQLLSYASTMCDDIGLTFAYYPVAKKAVVTDNGTTIVEISHAVKQTGSAAGVAGVCVALTGLMGACAVVAKKKNLVK